VTTLPSGIGLSPRERSILIWMCALIAANQLGFGAVVPVVALYAEDFGVSQAAIGLTIAIYGLARFLVNYPSGQLADRVGRKPVLALGGAITILGTVLCAVAPSYPLFLAARFVAGAGAALVLTAGQIVLTDIASPHNRGRVMAIYTGVFVFAVGAGSFPGGWLATHVGLASPFWANAVLAGVVTVLALAFVPETRNAKRSAMRSGTVERIGLRDQLRLLIAIPGFALICLVSFGAFFARTGGLFNVIPLLAEDQIGLAPDQIGLGIGMVSIVGLFLVYPSGALVDRFGRKAVIVPSAICSAGAMMLFAFATSFQTYLIASFLWAVASGIAGAAPAAYAADLAPKDHIGPAMGLYRTIADLGYVVGPLLLGTISDIASPRLALLVTTSLLVVSGGLFFLRAPETWGNQTREPAPSTAD
jgi:DHA1 family multidrug resistance protein-like MFS transporter